IEFSADFYGKELHILGYYLDPHHPHLKKKLKELIESRQTRNQEMLDQLAALGFPLTYESLYEDCDDSTIITRAHIANAMLKKGYITDRKEAFSNYIGDGKPAYVPKKHFTTKDCIDLIHKAGGLAVLAHPMLYGYDQKDVTNLIRGLNSEGLDGVECLYSTHSKEETNHLLQVCLNLDLFPTGGSDFHGNNKPLLDLGSGYGNLNIPFEILENMRKRRSPLC
ncbi:MAG: PHP domain-containing protein, partial [Candidatus Cellulosilyticum pullistercoris]|nr:PHP domain-containing protein [Candidatus Cellulosilyticum pullistercoris]